MDGSFGETTSRALLARAGIRRERMVEQGLQFARRVDRRGRFYFVSNPGDKAIDGWVPVRERRTLDPDLRSDDRQARKRPGSAARRADARCISRCRPADRSWSPRLPRRRANVSQSVRAVGESVPIAGPWTLRFVKGGPSVAARADDRSPDIVDGLRRGRGQLLRYCELHRDLRAPAGRGHRVADRSRPGPRERARPVEWPSTSRRSSDRSIASSSMPRA